MLPAPAAPVDEKIELAKGIFAILIGR
jgi:hypothetical protein